ncbi:MAG: rRNA maturation RNase YbeY [Hyphomicrobiales bacterium]
MVNLEILFENDGWAPVRAFDSMARRAVMAALEVAGIGNNYLTELCVRLTGNDEMAALNRTWRNKDGATNVLAFPATDGPLVADAPWLLGDVILAFRVVAGEAQSQGKSLVAHTCHLIIHATLHLLGHDHENRRSADIMEALEIAALATIGLPNPYERFPA